MYIGVADAWGVYGGGGSTGKEGYAGGTAFGADMPPLGAAEGPDLLITAQKLSTELSVKETHRLF